MSVAAAGTAVAVATAVAAVTYLPAFKNTRAGIIEGLGADLELGGEVCLNRIGLLILALLLPCDRLIRTFARFFPVEGEWTAPVKHKASTSALFK